MFCVVVYQTSIQNIMKKGYRKLEMGRIKGGRQNC